MENALHIVKLGHPTLRQIAAPVSDVLDPNIQALIDEMLVTLEESGGVGLAAPQVDAPLRIFIASSKPFPNYEDADTIPPTVMVNLEILSTEGTPIKNWEGCLSIPLLRGFVPRCPTLNIRYLNRDGALIEAEFHGLMARVIQHENDHLDGKLFLDRIDSIQDLMAEEEFQRQIVQPSEVPTAD